MDLRQFYYDQLVDAPDLNTIGTNAEAAERALYLDNVPPGVNAGLAVSAQLVPNLTVNVDAGVCRTAAGERVYVPSTQLVDVSVDSLGGTTAVTTAGNSKIISVFAKFKRNNQTPYIDGNSDPGYEDLLESFEIRVAQGAESAGTPSAPSLDTSMVLLADITRAYGSTAIVTGNISTARKQWAISASGSPHSVSRGKASDGISDLLGWLNSHITAAADKHADTDITSAQIVGATVTLPVGSVRSQLVLLQQATKIDKTSLPAWADATNIAATNVSAAMDAVVTKLAGTGGAGAIGAASHGNFTGATVAAQLAELDKTTTNDDGAKRVKAEVKGSFTATTVRGQLDELDAWKKLAAIGSYTSGTKGGVITGPTTSNTFVDTAIAVTINGLKANDIVELSASFGANVSAVGGGGAPGAGVYASVQFAAGGVAVSGSAMDSMTNGIVQLPPVGMVGTYIIPSNGNYTFKVQVAVSAGGQVYIIGAATMIAKVYR